MHLLKQHAYFFLKPFTVCYSVFFHLVGSCDLHLHGAHRVTTVVTPCLQLRYHGSNCTRLHISTNEIFHLQLIQQ